MVEGAGDLLRLDQRVRPVQQQDVHIVGAECAQRLLGLTHDVLIGEVVEGAVLHDPDLRLQGDLLPFGRAEPHGLGEAALTGMGAQTRTVDVGMVEEVDAGLPGRTHQGPDLLIGLLRDPHHSQHHLGCGDPGLGHLESLHAPTL